MSDTALIDAASGKTWSHSELQNETRALAESLAGKRSLALVLCQNSVATVQAYLACRQAGHPVLLWDAAGSAAALKEVLETYRPHWILGDAAAEAPKIDVQGYGYLPQPSLGVVDRWHRSEAFSVALHPDLAVLLSTSGTTGSAKLVRLSARNVDSNAAAIAEYLKLTSRSRPLSSLPLHYSYGLSVLNSHLHAGASLVLGDYSIGRPEYWETFRKFECNYFAAVPFGFSMLRRMGFQKFFPPTLKTITQAGGKLGTPELSFFHAEATRHHASFFVMYGQTEATARIAYLAPEHLEAKKGSVGVAIPGGKIWIDRGEAWRAAPGQEGEVIYEGPNVMMGYATSMGDLALPDLQHGLLRTGDTGFLDEDGFLFITGRSKRIAKLCGNRFNLDEIEHVLHAATHSAVVSDDQKLYVFLESKSAERTPELRRVLTDQYQLHPSLFEIKAVEDMPLLSSGKIDYGHLRELCRR